jgi:site-specific DNA-adenine methylase
MTLTAPFPYFGGKRRIAAEVWRRFGNVRSYVEPFFGSGAVLLARPQPFSGVETVNDLDGLLCNFWRAVKADPAAVARFADWPVSECDLTARHMWLVERRASITERLCADPEWFDAQAAGWWVWGACAWIGSGWCSGDGPWAKGEDGELSKLPHLGNAGQGINRKLPHLGNAGQGINRQLPHLGNAGRGLNRRAAKAAFGHDDAPAGTPAEWLAMLSDRLRGVRIACGSWERVTGDSVLNPTRQPGLTAVFLDPPYDTGSMDYSAGGMGRGIAAEVRAWALKACERHDLRIALCGYDEHDEMASAGWSVHAWKTNGGYSSQDGENANGARECIWFSPACIGARQPSLFDPQPEPKEQP